MATSKMVPYMSNLHADNGDHHDLEANRQFGFWIFLMTDCILFGTLFATYIVLHGNTNGGPSSHELFKMSGVIAETFILLTSSFTSGLAVLAMNKGNQRGVILWLLVTAILSKFYHHGSYRVQSFGT